MMYSADYIYVKHKAYYIYMYKTITKATVSSYVC